MKKDPLLSDALPPGNYDPMRIGRTIGSVQYVPGPAYHPTRNLDVQIPGTPPLSIPHADYEVVRRAYGRFDRGEE